ncbi:hypothetical protein PR202_ga14120 [Eleusine coracana subsp. coracana]|uniref:DUF7795 domain-containing protein n=1 Tax=Eleusine coracana subsp. coracana TaxID=191504 RepID=A0AAV5CFU4_ELECO|nr:hypothetical protein PR202_ga14120 [Eleusine coracana subsp. coracana]
MSACNFLCLWLLKGALNYLVSEYFRRPPIPNNSNAMSEILKSNCTDRMKSYMEAGCSLQCRNISNINQFKTLLQELECLVKDVHGITLTASLSALEVSESSSTDNELNNESSFIEDTFSLQEKIVNALSLKTPSSELKGYCLMWDLRPYIDDNVMHLAWKMCP